MKFISLNGSSCSGKSSVVKTILKERDHLFLLGYDSVKRSFSKYHHETHYADVYQVLIAMIQPLSEMGYDIISDSGLYQADRDAVFAEAKARGYEVTEITLDAPYDVLEKRFDERVAGALANPSIPISNLSKDRFKEIYEISQKEKNPSVITLDTSLHTLEETVAEVLKHFA